MAVITMREALSQALDEEMARDANVIIIGEEVGTYDGAYKVTKGLLAKYGSKRVIDTPISELAFTGVGVGAALVGFRPVVEWMTFNFGLLAIDQVINNAAKMRYMSGGQLKVPMVIRGPNGPAESLGSQHSQSFASFFAHIPGLKVVAPSTPYDAKGLLKAAIRDDNPVIFMESELMYSLKGEVPDGEILVPLGGAAVRREGGDVTLVGFSKPMKIIEEAADLLARDFKIQAEVLDLRSLRPLDEASIYASVRKTSRAVVVDEAWPQASVGSWVQAKIAENCFDDLDAPVVLVAAEDVPMPYNHALERAVGPDVGKIVAAVRQVLYLDTPEAGKGFTAA